MNIWVLVGEWLVTLVALVTVFGGLCADFLVPATARQHIYNPRWPEHAKFHNGQTMSLGILLGALALWLLWIPQMIDFSFRFQVATVITSFYWLAMFAARLFPGTAWIDNEFVDHTPRPFGLAPQMLLSLALVVLLCISYVLVLFGGM